MNPFEWSFVSLVGIGGATIGFLPLLKARSIPQLQVLTGAGLLTIAGTAVLAAMGSSSSEGMWLAVQYPSVLTFLHWFVVMSGGGVALAAGIRSLQASTRQRTLETSRKKWTELLDLLREKSDATPVELLTAVAHRAIEYGLARKICFSRRKGSCEQSSPMLVLRQTKCPEDLNSDHLLAFPNREEPRLLIAITYAVQSDHHVAHFYWSLIESAVQTRWRAVLAAQLPVRTSRAPWPTGQRRVSALG